jgi:DNA repair exonuclease SbcCD nuclease subunit
MVRFAHISDVHLGGWKQKEMQELNFASFEQAVEKCLNSNLDFILISGDLFDSAYPPIEILKKTFAEFKKLKDAEIPCFIIAGSHDYSVSGKTFLDVLEKAGFCKNIYDVEERDGFIFLNPTVYQNVAIYGYPGKKSGLELEDLKRIKLQDSPGLFKIFMLHTTIEEAKGNIPIEALEYNLLPKADYYALGHLHIDFKFNNLVYPGPIFPNNFKELEDLKNGSFYIVDTEKKEPLEKINLLTKQVLPIKIEIQDAHDSTLKIIEALNKQDLDDKLILLRVFGEIQKGSKSDIKFNQIEEFVKTKKAYFLLKNTHDLNTKELELEINVENPENIEHETIKIYSEKNPSSFNNLIPQLINALSVEKQEGETQENFKSRLFEEAGRILKF